MCVLSCSILPDLGEDCRWLPQRLLLLRCIWTHSVDSQSAGAQRYCVEICTLDSAKKPRGGFCIFYALMLTAGGTVAQYNYVSQMHMHWKMPPTPSYQAICLDYGAIIDYQITNSFCLYEKDRCTDFHHASTRWSTGDTRRPCSLGEVSTGSDFVSWVLNPWLEQWGGYRSSDPILMSLLFY